MAPEVVLRGDVVVVEPLAQVRAFIDAYGAPRGDALPVFAFKTSDEVDNFTVFDVSNAMRERGWQVPAYTFPKNREDLAAMRVVVRRGFTHDMADLMLADMRRQLPRLQQQQAPQHDEASAAGFRH